MSSRGLFHPVQGVVAIFNALPYKHPWGVIILALIMSAVGGHLYFFHLPIVSDREKLADQEHEFNRLNIAYQEEFGNHTDYLILVVKAKSGSGQEIAAPVQRAAMKKAGQRWTKILRKRADLFPTVIEHINWSEARASPLYYLPYDTFGQAIDIISDMMPLVKSWVANPTLDKLFQIINDKFSETESNTTEERMKLQGMLEGTTRLLHETRQQLAQSELPAGTIDPLGKLTGMFDLGPYDPDGYFFSKDGSLLTVYTLPARDSGVQNRYSRAMAYARQALQEVLMDKELAPLVDAGLAGLPALEEEEMATAQSDFGRSGLLTLVFVSLLFIVGFRNVSGPALATLCLSLSIAITFLFTWIVIGELNYLATIFAVILIALGIDFAIHFFTHYQHAITTGFSSSESIQRTQKAIGSSLWMSGMATAIAFFSIMFTEFPGLQDLGLIAGMGLIISLLCMYLVFPAMLFLLDTHRRKTSVNIVYSEAPGPPLVSHPFLRTIGTWLIVPVSLVATSGYIAGQYYVDTNLLNLQAVKGDASRWQRVLLSVDDRASFTIATFRDRSSLEKAQLRLQQYPQIISSTTSLFPSREAEKLSLSEPPCNLLSEITVGEPVSASSIGTRQQLFRMRQMLRKYRDMSNEAERVLAPLSAEIESLYRLLKSLPLEVAERRIGILQESMLQTLNPLITQLKRLFCPQPFNIQHAPRELQQQFVGKKGNLVLMIYPQKNSWDRENLAEFMTCVRNIIPKAFGGVAAIHDNAIVLIRSFMQAAIYSFVAMLFLLLFLTRSLRSTLLALLPLISGVGLLLAIMKWWPYPLQWNLASLFALPILIGIGIDGGVHLVRAYQQQQRSIFHGALKAVTYSSLTTMIGFGILATGVYQGGASLGLVLFIGITLNLFACLILLPPVLDFFLKSLQTS